MASGHRHIGRRSISGNCLILPYNFKRINFKCSIIQQSFYAANQLPYVCILDPRTGEEKRNYKGTSDANAFKFTAAEFLEELRSYLEEHNDAPSREENADADKNGPKQSKIRRRDSMDEEEQLRVAIANSLRDANAAEEGGASGSGTSGDLPNGKERSAPKSSGQFNFDSDSDTDPDPVELDRGFQPVNDQAVAVSTDYKEFLGPADDPITRLQLRLPDGQRDNLEWPCSSQIQALRNYVEQHYAKFTEKPYKIICAFPRKDLLTMDATETLLSAKLHPNALLHLHQDD